jgi:signal transduction histidine kinase
MAQAHPMRAARPGLSDFLLERGDLLGASRFPTLVADLRSGEVCLCNSVAAARLGFTPLGLADLFAADEDAVAFADALRETGRWEGLLEGARAAVAQAIPGGDGTEGVCIGLGEADAADASRALAASLVEGAESAFLGVDGAGRVVIANEAARRLLGPGIVGGLLAVAAPLAALHVVLPGPPVSGWVDGISGGAHLVEWRSAPVASRLWPLWGRDVTGSDEARSALEARVRRTEALGAVAAAAAAGMPVPDLATLALTQIESLIGTREARVTLVEADALRPVAVRRDGVPVAAEGRLMLSASPAREARSRRTAVVRPISDADVYPSLRPLEAMGVQWALLMPMRVEEAIFGFVEVYTDHDVFALDEIDLVRQMAGLISAALVRERQIEQISRYAHAMEQRVAHRNEELHRTNEQLIQATKLSSIGELAAGLVHELNQPLNVIGGYIELLSEGSLSDGARARALEVMARAVNRMTIMAENLRNFSRADGPAKAPVDLAEILHLSRELTAGAVRRGVKIDCPSGILVFGTATRLEQVVINLLANALQSDGDPVRMRGYADGDRAIIEVSDRGPGVPEAIRQRIFEPFFTTKPPGQGTGLGLSVSGRIIHDHGGRIEIHANPGGGALFRVVLPLHRARPVDSSAPDPV